MTKLTKKFVGIDVSKETIDVAVINESNSTEATFGKFDKTKKGYQSFLKWLKLKEVEFGKGSVFCMEHTGIYTQSIIEFLAKHDAVIWVEMAYTISRSGGLQRGKNDKIDAYRIALYAYKNKDNVKEWKQKSKLLIRLKNLMALRSRLLSSKIALTVPVNEFKSQGFNEEVKAITDLYKNALAGIEKSIEKVDAELKMLITKDKEIRHKYDLLVSVPGIGNVTAMYLLIYTDGFFRLTNAKQLACFCGVVPFEHSSGSSVRGRSRVHPMANKKLKHAIHMAALSSIRYNGEMKTYFERKVAEGKNKMCVLNAVRNKILHRAVAVIRNDKIYEPLQNVA